MMLWEAGSIRWVYCSMLIALVGFVESGRISKASEWKGGDVTHD